AGNESNSAGEPLAETEELPDWDELTPELMEDECVRGDFMIRGAVILLALLLGCVLVTETSVLVQIKTGEYLIDHGLLPPRHDVFSATASESPWINLHWGADLLLGLIHRFAGFTGLTVLSALTLAATFYLLTKVSLSGISDLWTSCCGAMALFAVFPVIQPGEMSVTLLGLSLLCLLLFRWSENPGSRAVLIGLPVLFLAWGNLDSRAWVGLIVLATFSVGQFIKVRGQETVPRSAWGGAAGGILAGLLINPWPGQQALAWSRWLYEQQASVAYRGISETFPRLIYGLKDTELWSSPNPLLPDWFFPAALLLMVVSFVCLLLNLERAHWGWLLTWIVVNSLAIPFGAMLCYAAIVNAAIASLCGQEWYRSRYSMDYSIATWPVLQARLSRVLVVIAVFLTAYTAINGMLMGVANRRIGLGLDPRWENRIASLKEDVVAHLYGETVYPTVPDVGDLLIWLGKRPFLDSRLAMYGTGDTDLVDYHQRVRLSIFPNPEDMGVPEPWEEALSEFETYDVVTRLWGDFPAYRPLLQLMVSRDWTLTGFGAAGANFTRSDLALEPLQAHLEQHRASQFIRQAFREAASEKDPDSIPDWPVPATSYDRWLVQKLPVIPRPAALANHYSQLNTLLGGQLAPQDACALITLAAREARRGIAENPNHPLSYRVLGNAQFAMTQLEQQVSGLSGSNSAPDHRMRQVQTNAYLAAQASGGATEDLVTLMQLQRMSQKLDLCRDTLNRILERSDGVSFLKVAFGEDFVPNDLLEQLNLHVAEVEAQIAEARGPDTSLAMLAGMAMQGFCPGLALSIVNEDLTQLSQNAQLQLLHATLLMECGQLQEAWDELEAMEQLLPRGVIPRQSVALMSQWRGETAAINLTANDLGRSLRLWGNDETMQLKVGIEGLLQQPFASLMGGVQQELWSGTEARLAFSAMFEAPENWAALKMKQAVTELEAGRPESAKTLLEEILAGHPEFSGRGLTVFYLNMMVDEPHD
ncbi:MAG: hypothetical protein KDA80_10995, partial [Planctomycetaceae bacterium]|nr:hypothetical protein [Planctomycetaceae bacterium]